MQISFDFPERYWMSLPGFGSPDCLKHFVHSRF
jgi:hypothetical protein